MTKYVHKKVFCEVLYKENWVKEEQAACLFILSIIWSLLFTPVSYTSSRVGINSEPKDLQPEDAWGSLALYNSQYLL